MHDEGDGSLASDSDSDDERGVGNGLGEGPESPLTQDALRQAYDQQQQAQQQGVLPSAASVPRSGGSSRGGSWLRGAGGSAALDDNSSVFSLDLGADAVRVRGGVQGGVQDVWGGVGCVCVWGGGGGGGDAPACCCCKRALCRRAAASLCVHARLHAVQTAARPCPAPTSLPSTCQADSLAAGPGKKGVFVTGRLNDFELTGMNAALFAAG